MHVYVVQVDPLNGNPWFTEFRYAVEATARKHAAHMRADGCKRVRVAIVLCDAPSPEERP